MKFYEISLMCMHIIRLTYVYVQDISRSSEGERRPVYAINPFIFVKHVTGPNQSNFCLVSIF